MSHQIVRSSVLTTTVWGQTRRGSRRLRDLVKPVLLYHHESPCENASIVAPLHHHSSVSKHHPRVLKCSLPTSVSKLLTLHRGVLYVESTNARVRSTKWVSTQFIFVPFISYLEDLWLIIQTSGPLPLLKHLFRWKRNEVRARLAFCCIVITEEKGPGFSAWFGYTYKPHLFQCEGSGSCTAL